MKLAQINFIVGIVYFTFSCSNSVPDDAAVIVYEESTSHSQNEQENKSFSATKSDSLSHKNRCSELYNRFFFETKGTVKEFNKNHWKGIFENDTIKIEYWSEDCLNQGCKITSKTSCAHSFYAYQNQILVTFDSIGPQCQKVCFFQLGMKEYSLPPHVKNTL